MHGRKFWLTIASTPVLVAACDSTGPQSCHSNLDAVLDVHSGLVGTRIGAEGGRVVYGEDAVVLTVPRGAVAGPCELLVAITPSQLSSNLDFSLVPGTAYFVEVADLALPTSMQNRGHGRVLTAPATLRVGYDPLGIPAKEELFLAEEEIVSCVKLFQHCIPMGAYRRLSTSTNDTASNVVTATLGCLGKCGASATSAIGSTTGAIAIKHPSCSVLYPHGVPEWRC